MIWAIFSLMVLGLIGGIVFLSIRYGRENTARKLAEKSAEEMKRYEKINSRPDVNKPFGRMRRKGN